MRLVAIAIVATLGGLTASASMFAGTAPTVGCDRIIDPGGTYTWRPSRVVLGRVDAPPTFIPQTVRSGDERWPFWSKSGLVVRADSPPVLVNVPRSWRSRVAITWGNSAIVSALRVGSCPASSSLDGWNAYTGGFYLRTRAACVPLTFRIGARSATVRFGVGKRCR